MDEPRTITLSQRGWLALVLFGAVMLALLAGQLAFIVQQREIVDHQRDIAARQEDRAKPVLGAANALIGDPDEIRAAAAEASRALTELREVLDTVVTSDVVDVTARALRRAPELLAQVDHAVELLERTHPTLRASLEVQQDSRTIQQQSLDVQRQSLEIQRQTLDTARRTLDIARQTLVHARSVDNKTGGPAPGLVP